MPRAKKHWLLLGLGLPAAMSWSIAATAAMPSWFDPSGQCALRAGRAGSAGVEIQTGWFPPRATCDFGGGAVYEFISPGRSVALSVTGVLVSLVVAAGLTLTVKSLFQPGGVIRSAEAVDLRRRRLTHLATALITGFLAVGGCVVLALVATFLGGPVGAVVTLITAAVALTAVASSIDRVHGPLPSTATQSRRRGATAATVTLVVALLVAASDLPIPTLRTALAGATAYAIVVAVQWRRPASPSRGRRPSRPLPGRSPRSGGRSGRRRRSAAPARVPSRPQESHPCAGRSAGPS